MTVSNAIPGWFVTIKRCNMKTSLSYIALVLLTFTFFKAFGDSVEEPTFEESISSLTIAAGRDATLKCSVKNLGEYKVAWIYVDNQTLLTIHTHVITKNPRYAVSHKDNRMWFLQIKNVQPNDSGYYMCQINTQPMKNQVGYLGVVVPPVFVNDMTSKNITAMENTNVTMLCRATGNPMPQIKWKREDGQSFILGHESVSHYDGEELNLIRVSRLHMGAYLCLASNQVPPAISRRIQLEVTFPPMIWIPTQLVGAAEGSEVALECHTEAYPVSSNYWLRENEVFVVDNERHEVYISQNTYKVHMKLAIRDLRGNDYGKYKCIAKNVLGETEGVITLYKSITPAITKKPPTVVEPTRFPTRIPVVSPEERQPIVQNNAQPPGKQQKYGEANSANNNVKHQSSHLLSAVCLLLIVECSSIR